MAPDLLTLCIEIAIQTAFLALALWIMIKIQKLNYKLLKLLGAAVLTTVLEQVLDMVLGRYVGIALSSYISTPIVVTVLLVCIAKITYGDPADVLFTVVIGYALLFGMNLFLLGAIMGDLRPSARDAYRDHDEDAVVEYQPADATNPPVTLLETTNKAVKKTPAVEKSSKKSEPKNSGAASPSPKTQEKSTTSSSQPAANPGKPVPLVVTNGIARSFSLKGIVVSDKPMAMIHSGVRTYTLASGESTSMETTGGRVTVSCEQLDKDRVILNVSGEQVTLFLPTEAP